MWLEEILRKIKPSSTTFLPGDRQRPKANLYSSLFLFPSRQGTPDNHAKIFFLIEALAFLSIHEISQPPTHLACFPFVSSETLRARERTSQNVQVEVSNR